jgi:hypothetical protein
VAVSQLPAAKLDTIQPLAGWDVENGRVHTGGADWVVIRRSDPEEERSAQTLDGRLGMEVPRGLCHVWVPN